MIVSEVNGIDMTGLLSEKAAVWAMPIQSGNGQAYGRWHEMYITNVLALLFACMAYYSTAHSILNIEKSKFYTALRTFYKISGYPSYSLHYRQ